MTIKCEENVLEFLKNAGLSEQDVAPGSMLWIEFCCDKAVPASEIADFYLKFCDWCELEKAAQTAGLTKDELTAVKKDFFAGRLTLKSAADRIHREAKRQPTTPSNH